MPPAESSNITNKHIDEQTVSLKEYFESRLCSLDKRLDDKFRSIQDAVETALAANEKRLDGMNEFRNTLTDQNRTFVTKVEFSGLKDLINNKFDDLENAIKEIQISDATLAGKASQSAVIIAYLISIIGLAVGLFSLFAK
jgi:hypothetical protein